MRIRPGFETRRRRDAEKNQSDPGRSSLPSSASLRLCVPKISDAQNRSALAPQGTFHFSPAMQRRNLPRLLDISREFQIHGEILHAEPCKVGHINETYTATYDQGGTRRAFWKAKLDRNLARDRSVTRSLRKAGWAVLRVWEHDLAAKHWPRIARRIVRALGR